METETKGIETGKVTKWFLDNLEEVAPPLSFELIPGGRSNLTYRVSDAAGRRYVLRRPPVGAVIATAHDMAREHRIISALAPTAVPVPPALGLCTDTSVNGEPFYVMDFVDGVVLEDSSATEKYVAAGLRRRLGDEVVEILAELHALDPGEVGLGDLGRKEAYLARQLKRWSTQWEKTKTREVPAMDEIRRGLEKYMPEQQGASIVHGDYRLGNMLVDEQVHVAAVLDWELCTLGDPLADLGYIINNWAEPDDGEFAGGAAISPTACRGFQSREEFLAAYEKASGRSVASIAYYRAFQYWRMAAIVEGVMSRYLKGVMGGAADTDLFRAQIDLLIDSALEMVRTME